MRLPTRSLHSEGKKNNPLFFVKPLKRITDLQDFIKHQSTDLTEFAELLVKRWMKQRTVQEDSFTEELKSGLRIKIDTKKTPYHQN